MKTPKHSRIVAWLINLSLILSMSAGIMVGDTANAATSGSTRVKVSADLSKQVKSLPSGSKVSVIMRAASSWSSTLDNIIKNNGGTIKRQYSKLNMRAVDLPAAAVNALSSRTDIAYISLDAQVKATGHVTLTTGTDAARAAAPSPTLDGTGIGIAIVDSGIDPNHQAFKDSSNNSRIIYNQDFTTEGRTDDPYGHGTHVAAIAAGNGNISQGAYQGIASNASIINLRVLDSQGTGSASNLLAAIDWILANYSSKNIRVVNMSLGMPAISSYTDDPVCQGVRRLVDAGLVVVAAAGNNGKDSSGQKQYGIIHCPGNEPSALTVGAANTFGTDSRSDDTVTTYSSRGPTRSYWTDSSGTHHYDNLVKPDIIAPGNKIISAEADNNYLVTQNPTRDPGVRSADGRRMMYQSVNSQTTH